jgi:type VII secretion protein EccB
MASRSDQLHSHQFTLQRVVGALAMRDPDPVSSPMRRIGGALMASILIAALAVAAVGVFGLFRPGGGDSWREGTKMIIESETGARYVFIDDVLYPVLNQTSALLILGADNPEPIKVARSELVGVTRGSPLGIPGAPDPLPGKELLVTDPWTVCSRPPAGQSVSTVGDVETVLRVGTAPVLDAVGERGVLVADPSDDLHLIWNNRRYRISDPSIVAGAFTWDVQSASAVPAGLLNAIPAGQDISPIVIADAGKSSPINGLRVGDVFKVTNQSGSTTHGVALTNGAAIITPLQADLLASDGNGETHVLTQSQYADAPKADSLEPKGDHAPPRIVPEQVRASERGGICATYQSGNPAPQIGLAAAVPAAPGEVRVLRDPDERGDVADWVSVPPGRGVVVESLATAGAPNGSLAIVSDLGFRFAVPSAQVMQVLGYGGVTPQRMPASMVTLLPSGHALDPVAASMPATVGV